MRSIFGSAPWVRPRANAPPLPYPVRAKPGLGARPASDGTNAFPLLQLNHDGSLGNHRRVRTDIRPILLDPFPRNPRALIATAFVLTDGNCRTAVSSTKQGVAHEALDGPDET